MNDLVETPKLLITDLDTNYILSSATDYSSKSNTTNTSSSSNSLHFNEYEDDEYCQSKGSIRQLDDEFTRLDNHISNGSQLITSLTSSLIRTNPSSSSSSSSTTSSSNENHEMISAPQTKKQHIFLLNAFVNGFVQLKLCADKIDYEYIIEIYWSNETKSYVKRTYEDFVTFHRHLIQVFSLFFNEIKSNVNRKQAAKNHSNSMKVHGNEEYLMPLLPAAKKSFWIGHLKHAEAREIELNDYVQRLLKLPTKIAHSDLVLKFFESQTSDPKPAKLNKYSLSPTDLNLTAASSFNPNHQQICISSIDLTRQQSDSPTHQIINDFYEYDQENNDGADYDEDEEDDDQYSNSFESTQNYNNLPISHSMLGLNHCTKKQSQNREAGLWWDEDEALNELTSSMSFDFGSHNQYNKFNFEENDDGTEDMETLKTLEKILKNSDLFKGDNRSEVRESQIASASSSMLKPSLDESLLVNKRLSLS